MLVKNMEYYLELFDNAYEPILLIDGHNFIDGNQAALNILNMKSKDELSVIHPAQLSPMYQPDGRLSSEKADEMIEVCYAKGFNRFEWMHKNLEEENFLVEVTLKIIKLDGKQVMHVVWNDIKQRKKDEEELKKKNEILVQQNSFIHEINETLQNSNNSHENLLESLILLEQYKKAIDESSIVSKADLSGKITYVNKRFCEISGYSKKELIGANHNIIRHPNAPTELFEKLWETISSKQVFKGVIQNKKKNGESYYVDSTIIPLFDKNKNIREYIAIRHDISSVYEKDKLIYEQNTDELTTLPNRQKLLTDIKSQILPKLALINIDRFKDINDSYGIEVGDKILKEVTKRLLKMKFSNLNVYRIGGDIFALLAFGNFHFDELYKRCQKLLINMDSESFLIEDNDFDISFTIGISSGQNKLLTHAEVALSSAKQNNKDIVLFDENMPIYKELKKNIELTKDIKNALSHDNILMYGQKIIDNQGSQNKYETLMRMKMPDGKIISPFFFIEHAQKARLYPLLTRTMIKKGCEYFQNKDIQFSLNLMLPDILNEKTIEYLIKKIKETNTANQVVLEIVESEGIEHFDEVKEFIKRVKDIGCKVAIDDFGTGYSNFEYIIELNIDILKIDGSLIKNIHINDNIKLTVSTIVNFAKVLGIEVVAEFVHNEEVQNIIEELGIHYSQGFYHHEPELLV